MPFGFSHVSIQNCCAPMLIVWFVVILLLVEGKTIELAPKTLSTVFSEGVVPAVVNV
jgi:hypothetical protein